MTKAKNSEENFNPMAITLPSGLAVTLKPMTGKAERVLEDKKLYKTGALVDRYMMECIETIGDKETMTPQEKERALLEMLSGDRNYLLMAIRIEGFGPDMIFTSTCPKCGKESGYQINLQNKLDDGTFPVIPYQDAPQRIELPVSGGYAEIGYMTGQRERQMAQLPDNAIHQGMLLRIESLNGERPTLKDLENMHGRDLLALRAAMGDMRGGLDSTIELDCGECGASYKISIASVPDFFVPSMTSLESAGI